MDTISKLILAIIFFIIVCTDIITYIVEVEKLQTKSKKKLLFFKTLSKVLCMCLIMIMLQLIAEIFETIHSA